MISWQSALALLSCGTNCPTISHAPPEILPCDFCESYVVRPLQIKSVVKSVRIPNSAVLKTFLEMIYIYVQISTKLCIHLDYIRGR